MGAAVDLIPGRSFLFSQAAIKRQNDVLLTASRKEAGCLKASIKADAEDLMSTEVDKVSDKREANPGLQRIGKPALTKSTLTMP